MSCAMLTSLNLHHQTDRQTGDRQTVQRAGVQTDRQTFYLTYTSIQSYKLIDNKYNAHDLGYSRI